MFKYFLLFVLLISCTIQAQTIALSADASQTGGAIKVWLP